MKTETPQQALERIQEGASNNDKAVLAAFSARGIALADIEPRVNVLTFRAWKAKGRSVCKGEHGRAPRGLHQDQGLDERQDRPN